MKVSDYKALFVSEANDIIAALEESVMMMENGSSRKGCIEELFRNAHNLKGMSGAMGYTLVVEASHAMENILDGCRKDTIRIGSSEIDLLLRVIDLLGELIKWTVEEEEGLRGEELLGEILVLLSPMSRQHVSHPAAVDKRPKNEEEPGQEEDSSAEGAKEYSMDVAEEESSLELPDQACESGIEPGQPKNNTAGIGKGIRSTRVDLERLDCLMDLVGELIISRIRLSSLAEELGSRPLFDELASSGRLISEIQKEVMEARLVPVGQVFHRFKRLARDTSRELGKKVDFEIIGSDIGLDRTVLESMVDPLVHMIRNAIDHGVESPEERISAGKKESGKVVLSARREKNQVILEVTDDGKGVDLDVVRTKERSGRSTESKDGDFGEEELCRILTSPGFSTRDKVSRFSGRGVGMNVVKETIDSLGGSLKIKSTQGEGTSISMYLPINLSIIKALLFYVGDDVHALPIEYVKETTRIEQGTFTTIRGETVFETKDGPITIIRPDDVFGLNLGEEISRFVKVLIVDTGRELIGLVVNSIIGQQDVVIKSLPTMVRGASGISGATILGSGKIAFIWDPRILFNGRSTHESDKEAVVLEN